MHVYKKVYFQIWALKMFYLTKIIILSPMTRTSTIGHIFRAPMLVYFNKNLNCIVYTIQLHVYKYVPDLYVPCDRILLTVDLRTCMHVYHMTVHQFGEFDSSWLVLVPFCNLIQCKTWISFANSTMFKYL